MDQSSQKRHQNAIEWVESITGAVALILLIFVFVAQPANVDGASMLDTLTSGDKILLRSAFYTPKKGDIVVIDSYNAHGKTLVKRIIATGGDSVYIDNATGTIYVNGTQQPDPPSAIGPARSADIPLPVTLADGEVFVMGDNRPGSLDSRYTEVGLIDERDIMGGVFFRLTPHIGRVN